MDMTPEQRVTLHGFNNLTKSLSFNMYDVCYTKTRKNGKRTLNILMSSITRIG